MLLEAKTIDWGYMEQDWEDMGAYINLDRLKQ